MLYDQAAFPATATVQDEEDNKHEQQQQQTTKRHKTSSPNTIHILVDDNNNNTTTNNDEKAKIITILIPDSIIRIPDARARAILSGTESRAIALLSLNAYVSTLGGGYFLCKRVDVALQMAYRQHQIAVMLDNSELAGQCRIHVCYILMQQGKLSLAAQRLHDEKMEAKRTGSEKHAAIVQAAVVYLIKLNRIQAELKRKPIHKKGEIIQDDYYRQRFVAIGDGNTNSST